MTKRLVLSFTSQFALAIVLSSCLLGCYEDTGDTSYVPEDSGADATEQQGDAAQADGGTDSTSQEADGAADSTPEGGSGPDATEPSADVQVARDTGVDAEQDAGTGADAGTRPDSGADGAIDAAANIGVDAAIESGSDATGRGDAASETGGASQDAGADAMTDTGGFAISDAGAETEGSYDASIQLGADTGTDGAEDAPSDTATGVDTGTGSGPLTCTEYKLANTQVNSSLSTPCTQTEEFLFSKDPTGGFLGSLFMDGCLDDNQGDSNKECDDLTSPADQMACLTTLSCDLGGTTFASSPGFGDVLKAYCGSLNASQCTASATAPAGACASEWNAGYPFSPVNPSLVLSNIAHIPFPSGYANGIVGCANTNSTTF